MDFSILIPALVAMAPIVITLITYGGKLVNLARDANRDVSEVRSDVAEMKPKVDKIEVLVQGMADGKERMDRLENRLERLEVKRA